MRDPHEATAVRAGGRWKPCIICGRLHTNLACCSYQCRNKAGGARMAQTININRRKLFESQIRRMIARCKVLGQTEDERLILAWRYGLGASKARRFRQKAREAARTLGAVDPHAGSTGKPSTRVKYSDNYTCSLGTPQGDAAEDPR